MAFSSWVPQVGIRHARGLAKYDAAMAEGGFAMFETALGACALVWRGERVAGVQLPESDPHATRARVSRRFPDAEEAGPSPLAQQAIDRIVALLAGAPVDFGDLPLDESGLEPFARHVYAVARTIGPGTTATYGEIAERIGDPGSARAVGRALGANPFPIVVPCHRVLAAGGRIGGFSAGGGASTKRRLLEIENARFGAGPDLFAAA
jgi:methylated-DNA-[protein]-cysteine S-methyltransferase